MASPNSALKAAVLGELDNYIVQHIESLAKKTIYPDLLGCAQELEGNFIDFMGNLKNINLGGNVFPDSRWSVFATKWISSHTDPCKEDYTLGIVLNGNHRLYINDGRRLAQVGVLERGSVYVLHNKTPHAARLVDKKSDPLVFVTLDFVAKNFEDALKKARKWFHEINQSKDLLIELATDRMSAILAENEQQEGVVHNDESVGDVPRG